jgi:acyl dehydratase
MRVQQRGLWFEELDTEVVYEHRPGRTMTEYDNVLFSTLSMNPQAIHLDAAYSATQPFGRPLVNSMFTLATLVGLSVAHLTRGTIVANLGFSDVVFPKPLFHGDTLYAETVVASKRDSKSWPNAGIVSFEHTGRNQDGVVVATATRQVMMLRGPDSEGLSTGGA